MFKTREEVIVIQAEATTPIPTGVVFWSHDKGTAKLIFQLREGNVNQLLANGTVVPILLEFNSNTADNGRGRHIYNAEIVDALSGIVSIVLEDNILGYVGRVDGSIYIELPDSRSLDTAGRFTFDIKRSPIDEDVPELEDYFYSGFEQFNAQFVELNKKITHAKNDLENVAENATKEVDKAALEAKNAIDLSLSTAENNLKTIASEVIEVVESNNVYNKTEADQKFISLAENQTVLGTKNFQDGIQLDGDEGLFREEALEVNAGDSIMPISSFSRGSMVAKRKGKTVQIFLSFAAAKVLTKNTPFITVPSNWKPSMDSLGTSDASSSLVPLRVWISPNGGISANKDIAVGFWVDVSIVYLID